MRPSFRSSESGEYNPIGSLSDFPSVSGVGIGASTMILLLLIRTIDDFLPTNEGEDIWKDDTAIKLEDKSAKESFMMMTVVEVVKMFCE
mmetsp:Transcript_2576/g.2992  ORF Transcript_2576/g.2992 Transcript_2576/m.2992 type:complete len:89 (+) Transcript_2576:889-1155(+)